MPTISRRRFAIIRFLAERTPRIRGLARLDTDGVVRSVLSPQVADSGP